MHKQQVVQRLYDDTQGVRRCEVCGCRFDPARMQLHMQRYSSPPWTATSVLRLLSHILHFVAVLLSKRFTSHPCVQSPQRGG